MSGLRPGFITNHGYLDNPTFRGMRWHLMQTFDRIHVLDLHGNSNKKEVSPDGSPDKNVFDIMQGVAIIVAVKHRNRGKAPKPLAEVHHGELWGTRDGKYVQLWDGTAASLAATPLPHKAPQFPFVLRDYDLEADYAKGFSVAELMSANVTGIVTMGDGFIIADSPAQLKANIDYLLNSGCSAAELKVRYGLGKNYADWVVDGRSKITLDEALIVPISYRPLDSRWTYFDNRLLWRWRESVMRHLTKSCNLNLMMTRQTKDEIGALVGDSIAAHKAFSAYDITYNMPLYLYPEEGTLDQTIRVNFDPKLYAQIRKSAGLNDPLAAPDGTDTFRTATGDARPDEVKVFDYIYGVLHSPAYRACYAEFLKIDFPRVPFPASPKSFRAISEQGEALRRLHLMEDAAIGEAPYPFHGDGNSVVDKPRHENGQVWINANQYFDGVPPIAWDFHIGGYQPAQKWLKDRKGRALTYDEIRHYQRIIKILAETDRIMRTIEVPLD